MDDPKTRPTTEIRSVIINSMDNMFGQSIQRVEGMNDDEYLWEPAANSWSVRRGINELDWWARLGEAWGPFSEHCVADMAIHASNELVHHGAEIALLRDLYRSRPKQ